jgi:hypothetical protein
LRVKEQWSREKPTGKKKVGKFSLPQKNQVVNFFRKRFHSPPPPRTVLGRHFQEESVEERGHAELLMNYQIMRGGHVELQAIMPPQVGGGCTSWNQSS